MPPRTEPQLTRSFARVRGRLGRALPRAIAWLLFFAATATAQVPPDAAWRTLETAHFRVNYMVGLDSLAHRTAARAEWAYERLAEELTDPPSGRIDIVLTDAVDYANGSATPLPTNRIVLYAHPPSDVAELSFTTDWLELLVLHELVHIFHLDEAGGVWQGLRSVVGRNALLFPHAYSPSWLVEGLATHLESRLTPGGRVRGSIFEMALRTAALEDRLFSIDRASGTPRSWPGGSSRYIYGALFLDHLARREGVGGFREFLRRYASHLVPYRLDRAAERSFGESFTRSWATWTDSLRQHFSGVADSLAWEGITEPEILTSAGRHAHHPRFAPDGRSIAYSAATGREQPAVRVVENGGADREVAPRAILGPLAWTRDGEALLFGDVQFRGPYRIHADLWVADAGGDDRQRLTRSARVDQPDLHPDGRTVAAVRNAGGTNLLVVGDLEGGEFLPLVDADLGTHWAHPRWSPSGEMIAAVRWSPGGLHDIVLLDRAGRILREVTRDRAVDGAPTWSPDGRYILFWSDRTGIPNLFAYEVATERLLQVTRVLSGAFDPDVSPDGRWIAFSYYRADGYHIARMPFDPGQWWPAPPPRREVMPLPAERSHRAVESEVRRYSPWPTVAPSAWTLLAAVGEDLGTGLGAALGGVDVVGRHRWGAEGLWYFGEGRFDGGAAYRYQGWGNPGLEVAARQEWSVACARGSTGCITGEPLASALLRREREAALSLLWVRQRMRSYAWLRPSAAIERRELLWDEAAAGEGIELRQLPSDLALRLEAGRSSARAFELTVGPQTGFSIVGSVEGHRYTRALTGDDEPEGYVRTVLRGRAFRPARLAGVSAAIALRGDVGVEVGSRSPGFSAGGAAGGVLPIALELDLLAGGGAFPIRGYPEGVQFGSRVATGSAEYRFPLLRVERGLGLIPVYLDRLTADLFVDGGTAWCPGDCPARLDAAPESPRVLSSLGGEVVAESRFGFHTSVPLRLGVALPLQAGRSPQLYLRVGRSF